MLVRKVGGCTFRFAEGTSDADIAKVLKRAEGVAGSVRRVISDPRPDLRMPSLPSKAAAGKRVAEYLGGRQLITGYVRSPGWSRPVRYEAGLTHREASVVSVSGDPTVDRMDSPSEPVEGSKVVWLNGEWVTADEIQRRLRLLASIGCGVAA